LVASDSSTNIVTGFTYASSWSVTSTTGANGEGSATAYDGFGRPTSMTLVDGASVTYAYTPNTQTATQTQPAPLTGNRFKRTTVDGFGRSVRVETGHDGLTVSTVDTQYGPCACSPLGKMVRVSQPYAPGAIPVWTTYTYDSSGRTLTVTSPDGTSVTRYTYHGNQTTVTDPAGKWKTFTTDAMGNLVTVTEPDPVSGTDVTNYTYNAVNQLLTVSMPRSSGTQTRSFVWTGSDMTTATNPENGTVTYSYDGAHRVKTRTDAKGQKTQYTYDGYGRKTMVQHFNSSQVELTSQRVTYTYGDNYWAPTDFSQNSWGRVASVAFSNETPGAPEQFQYLYSYTPAGRVTKQRMHLGTGSASADMDAVYEWDNEGKMTSTVPPGGGLGGGTPNKYLYFYDAQGRLNGMTETSCLTQTVIYNACSPNNGSTVATAGYGAAGEMTALTYDGYSETRTYNSLLQLTRMTATGSGQTVMDMQYTFSGTQNNGRITQSTDGTIAGGETVVYTYDTLNRLTKAETTSAAWGEAYTYDGFGNLTAKTATKGTAPTMSATYDAATNRQVGQTYDANGNPGYNGTYPYDVENRLMQPLAAGTGPQWTYDGSGKRVFAKTPGNGTTVATTCEIYFYGITGQKLTTYQCGYNDGTGGNGQFWYQVKSRNVYFGGKLMRSAGVTVVTDRLGSVRANSNWERMNYFPYGEERTSTADGREKFGTYFRDSGGVDYADQRYYASAGGRFLTPDPYSATASSPTDSKTPGSWNRYAYVQSDSINFRDRQGLIREAVGEGSSDLLVIPDNSAVAVTTLSNVQNQCPWYNPFCYTPPPAPPEPPPPPPPNRLKLCEQDEGWYIEAYLQGHLSPLAAFAQLIVEMSDAYGVDDRFIVALAGAETTYGIHLNPGTWGPFNYWSVSSHKADNPYGDPQSAIVSVVDIITTDSRYFRAGRNTTGTIYPVWQDPGYQQGLRNLNSIYHNLGGSSIPNNPTEVNFSRCK
jgi:RHS repeat-associated protein